MPGLVFSLVSHAERLGFVAISGGAPLIACKTPAFCTSRRAANARFPGVGAWTDMAKRRGVLLFAGVGRWLFDAGCRMLDARRGIVPSDLQPPVSSLRPDSRNSGCGRLVPCAWRVHLFIFTDSSLTECAADFYDEISGGVHDAGGRGEPRITLRSADGGRVSRQGAKARRRNAGSR